MFLDFYKMKEQPFGVTPDPRFLYLGESHREALASLYYGIESERGFIALIAPPGLGKTTLTFQLLEKFSDESRSVFLFQTQCNSRELFHYLLNGLGVEAEGMELVSMHNKLNQILCREMLAGRRFILVIDEAQNLDPQVLETIRLLSNFETSRGKMLQILLIGQPQLAIKLASPELEQLQQRISMFARLEPFSSEDTARYISHRLQIAGYEGPPLFTPGALRIIAEQSQGIPRKINSLCFSALSLGCAMGREQVDAAIMEEAIADRDVESLLPPSAARRVARSQPTSTPTIFSPLAPFPTRSSSVMSRPTLSSFSEKNKKSFGPWAMGAASLAALVAIGIGVLSLTPNRIDRFVEVSSSTWNSIRSAVTTIGKSTESKMDSAPGSSALTVQAADLSSADARQTPTSNDNMATVQPGENLQQIIVRTIGGYNVDAVEQIRKLNPAIADLDHLESGQTIRLPVVATPVEAAVAGDGTGTSGSK